MVKWRLGVVAFIFAIDACCVGYSYSEPIPARSIVSISSGYIDDLVAGHGWCAMLRSLQFIGGTPWYWGFSSMGSAVLPADVFSGRDLTPREEEIAGLVAQGLSNKEICSLLGISHGTVKNHVFSIFRKLGVQSRFELVKFIKQ